MAVDKSLQKLIFTRILNLLRFCFRTRSLTVRMNLDANLYSPKHIPMESARTFVVKKLLQMGWGKIDDEVILDVGCGPGGTTKELILPLFQKSVRIFAMDAVPSMISLAKEQNSSTQIEYSVADIEDWNSLKSWDNQITKLVSILCFHWLKNQRNAFHNVYRLLQKGGEAAFFFALQSTFHSTILEIQNNSKWSHLFKGVENYVPESHHKKYDASHYKQILEEMGFEVLLCQSGEKIDVFPSEEEYRDFFTSICVLRNYVREQQLDEFEKDYIQTLLQKNGRDANGIPFHKGNFIEVVVRKK